MRFGKKFLSFFNATLTRKVNGRQIKVPFINGVKVGVSGEPFLLEVVNHVLPKIDGAVVDVGVNLGQTLIKVKAVKPDQQYFGFEPNPACFGYLEQLVKVNGWADVRIFPCAVSDETTVLQLHFSSQTTTDARGSLLPALNPTMTTDRVKDIIAFDYARLDPLIEQRIGLLKIDVEGAELEVIRGMAAAIKRDRPVIAIEMWPFQSSDTRRKQTMELLHSCGYKLFSLQKDNDAHWAGLMPVDESSHIADDMHDFLAIPVDDLETFDAVVMRDDTSDVRSRQSIT